ncbi:(2Fe-2S)-binding protein [Nannocystis pusilla]|uniref:(2Fe-2S)-binding protein n=1 Tax=Nannocystis pusilla TaxID=889268 RepID=UPI003B77B16E
MRSDLGLTGCKESCGHGACGACSVLLDDVPVAACLLPAVALHRRRLTTVEGLAPAGELHPVQRAFMAEDALQCGFAPRLRRRSQRFYTRWRAEHGNQEPDRDTVAAALAGNLCRCAAYDGIIRAVQRPAPAPTRNRSAPSPRPRATTPATRSPAPPSTPSTSSCPTSSRARSCAPRTPTRACARSTGRRPSRFPACSGQSIC